MKQIAHIDKKWQSSVTAYVKVTYDDGSRKYYLKGRYGGGSLSDPAAKLGLESRKKSFIEKIFGKP